MHLTTRFIILLIAYFSFFGCSTISSSHSKGKLLKTENTGVRELVDTEIVLTGLSPSSVKVEKHERYGDKVIEYYERVTEGSRHEPVPSKLLEYNFARLFVAPIGLVIVGPLAQKDSDFYVEMLEFLFLPIPNCSRAAVTKLKQESCRTGWFSEVGGENILEVSHVNTETVRSDVTTGSVAAVLSSADQTIYREDLPISIDGTASLDLAKLYDKVQEGGIFSLRYQYKTSSHTVPVTYAEISKALAARKPPQLEIAKKIETEGGLKRGVLIGDDAGSMIFTVTNKDFEGTAWGVNLVISGNSCPGVSYEQEVKVGDIRPQESRLVKLPIKAHLDATTCSLKLIAQAKEEFGQDSKKVNVPPLNIKPIDRPQINITKIQQDGLAQNDSSIELEAIITNTGIGEAKGVTLKIGDLPKGVTASSLSIAVGDLLPGASQKVPLSVHFDKTFGEESKPVVVPFLADDRRPIGKPAVKNYAIDYHFNKPVLKIADIEFFDGNDPDHLSQGNGNNLIDQGERILALVNVTNTGTIAAKNVMVSFSTNLGASRFPIDPSEPIMLSSLKPGETKKVPFKFRAPNSISGDVGFTANASEEDFHAQVASTSRRKVYDSGTDDGVVEVTKSKVAPVRVLPVSTGVSIDEVIFNNFKREDSYALVVGIGNYKNVSNKLPYAAADAKTIKDYLVNVGGVPREHIQVLTDDDATYTGIKSKLSWIANRADSKATVFVYFSGHGTADLTDNSKQYLLPYDGDPTNLKDTGLSMAELKQKLNSLKTKKVLVALEACYTGGDHSVVAEGAHPVALVTDDDTQTEAVILSASRASEASWDHPVERHGIFTYALLNGMRGAAAKKGKDFIDAEDLFEYIRKEVPQIAEKVRGVEQRPTKGGNGKGLVVSRCARKSEP